MVDVVSDSSEPVIHGSCGHSVFASSRSAWPFVSDLLRFAVPSVSVPGHSALQIVSAVLCSGDADLPIGVVVLQSVGSIGHHGERFVRVGHSVAVGGERVADWSDLVGADADAGVDVGSVVYIAFEVLNVVGLDACVQGLGIVDLCLCW